MKLNNIMRYCTKLLFLNICLLLGVISCSEQNGTAEPCPITVDSVSIIDAMEICGETYYLVYRISGLNDKTEILELYNLKPTFDNCSRSNVEPLYGDSLDMLKTVSHVYLNVNDRFLELLYVDGEPDKLHNAYLKLEVK